MLKFFATNRSIDRLGRAIRKNRSAASTRHRLSKGGYYFVDMDEYTRHYLATTDAEEMPTGAIVRNSGEAVFAETFLRSPKIRSIVVCVHGFNVELHEASTWFRILTDTMKNIPGVGGRVVTSPADLAAKQDADDGTLTAFVGFSWPSNGRVLSYLSDQTAAVDSKTAFASLLARLKTTKKIVDLIGHSMGNYLICHTLAALIDKQLVPVDAVGNSDVMPLFDRDRGRRDAQGRLTRKNWLIDNYVMIAPDVERRHITRCDSERLEADYEGPFYGGLDHLVRHKVNLYSRFDGALTISNLEKMPREMKLAATDVMSKLTFGLLEFLERNPDQRWEKRLGEAPAPVNAAPGFTSVNATELANRKIGHSDHIDARAVVERIAHELKIPA